MQKSFEMIRQPRQFLISLTEQLTLAQLNQVPAGFNNNIIWNLGHIIAAQQKICYWRVGLPIRVSDTFFGLYTSDTKPERPVTPAELNEIKESMISTVDQLEKDYANGIFADYTPWNTRYGVAINSIEDAISFLPFHEGLHLGYIQALKRVI